MPAREQLLAALRGNNQDRPLVMPIVYGLAARLAQVSLRSYLTDAESMARCQMLAAASFDYDAVFAYGDNTADAEAFGSVLDWQGDFYPRIAKPVIQLSQGVDSLFQLKPSSGSHREVPLSACGYLNKQSDRLVVGTVFGPLSLAGQLLGLERLVLLAVDQPELFQQVLAYLRTYVDDYAASLAARGADILMLYEPTASPAVITGEIFRTCLHPLYQGMLQSWSGFGCCVWLNIIGPLRRFLPLLTGMPFDLLTVDGSIAWKQARGVLPAAWLVGNLPAPAFAIESADEIETAMKNSVQGMDWRTAAGADCELPLDTGRENLRALVRIGRKREG